jgi:hypothetical protein
MAICRFANNKDFTCFPSREAIAAAAGVQVRQVQRIVPALIERGFISRTAGKGRTPSLYTVKVAFIKELIGRGDMETPLDGDEEDDSESRRGDTVTPQVEGVGKTLTPSLGGYQDSSRETLTPRRGDIDDSYIGRIGKESVIQSVKRIGQVHAREAARKLSLAVNPEASADLREMATRIAVAHPRNMLKHITALEVPTRDLKAIVAAILLEAAKRDMSQLEAGETLLRMVQELQAVVPREQWQFLAPVDRYFAEFEYRGDPMRFVRSTSAKGGASNVKRRGTEGNDDLVQRL